MAPAQPNTPFEQALIAARAKRGWSTVDHTVKAAETAEEAGTGDTVRCPDCGALIDLGDRYKTDEAAGNTGSDDDDQSDDDPDDDGDDYENKVKKLAKALGTTVVAPKLADNTEARANLKKALKAHRRS